jgi:hypothetical protein
MKRIVTVAGATLAGLLAILWLAAFRFGGPISMLPDGGLNATAGTGGPPAPAPAPATIVVSGGMAGWQIMLIAIGSALVAAIATIIVDRLRFRRHLTTTTA